MATLDNDARTRKQILFCIFVYRQQASDFSRMLFSMTFSRFCQQQQLSSLGIFCAVKKAKPSQLQSQPRPWCWPPTQTPLSTLTQIPHPNAGPDYDPSANFDAEPNVETDVKPDAGKVWRWQVQVWVGFGFGLGFRLGLPRPKVWRRQVQVWVGFAHPNPVPNTDPDAVPHADPNADFDADPVHSIIQLSLDSLHKFELKYISFYTKYQKSAL